MDRLTNSHRVGFWIFSMCIIIMMWICTATAINSLEGKIRVIMRERKDTIRIRYDGWNTIVDSVSFKKEKGKADTIIVRFYKNQDSILDKVDTLKY